MDANFLAWVYGKGARWKIVFSSVLYWFYAIFSEFIMVDFVVIHKGSKASMGTCGKEGTAVSILVTEKFVGPN